MIPPGGSSTEGTTTSGTRSPEAFSYPASQSTYPSTVSQATTYQTPTPQVPAEGSQMVTPGSFGGVGTSGIPSLEDAQKHGNFLGEGEFASVYHFPGSTDAVKYIDPDLMGDPGDLSREYDIAKRMGDAGVSAQIRGANFSETEEGTRYPSSIHMEYLQGYRNVGDTLRGKKAEQMSSEDQQKHNDFLFDVGLDTLRRSRDMHSEGVVHDDLHDENIMVDDSGNVRIIDFGLADENPKNALRELLQHNNKRSFSYDALDRIGQKNPELADSIRGQLDSAKKRFDEERFSGKKPDDYLRDIHSVYDNIGRVVSEHGHEF